MQFDHFNIAAPMELLEKVREFYCDVLGFEAGFRPAFRRRGFWLYMGGKPLIHLIESEQHFAPERAVYLDHIAFRASGLSGVKESLEKNRVSYRSSFIEEFNMTQLFFNDPAGTGLEVNFPGES